MSTRKDIAATFTRKIIFDSAAPTKVISRSFRNVTDVVITIWGLAALYRYKELACKFLGLCIGVLGSPDINPTPLHLTIHLGEAIASNHESAIRRLLSEPPTLVPMTFELVSMSMYVDKRSAIDSALRLGAVVHFKKSYGPPDHFWVARRLAQFLESRVYSNAQRGSWRQAYLCDIPEYVLTPDELARGIQEGNAVERAKYKLVKVPAPTLREALELVEKRCSESLSKVTYVQSGFRPSPAEVIATLKMMLVQFSSFGAMDFDHQEASAQV
jgi:hypothetical protein